MTYEVGYRIHSPVRESSFRQTETEFRNQEKKAEISYTKDLIKKSLEQPRFSVAVQASGTRFNSPGNSRISPVHSKLALSSPRQRIEKELSSSDKFFVSTHGLEMLQNIVERSKKVELI